MGSLLVVVVLQFLWGLFMFGQWGSWGSMNPTAYAEQSDVGRALLSGTGLVLAIAAVVLGAKAIRAKVTVDSGWAGVCIGALLALGALYGLYDIIVAGNIW